MGCSGILEDLKAPLNLRALPKHVVCFFCFIFSICNSPLLFNILFTGDSLPSEKNSVGPTRFGFVWCPDQIKNIYIFFISSFFCFFGLINVSSW